ncbi:MAG: nucleotidyl transferase AbiEii/AbiGii toxin family protein [Acetobacteraceae bacterium]
MQVDPHSQTRRSVASHRGRSKGRQIRDLCVGLSSSPSHGEGGENVKLLVEGNGQRIKVEVNFVLRGTLLPVTQRPLVSRAQELFTTDVTLPVLDLPELYGGKLVAAMDRQHPRDMFDVPQMQERSGWRSSFVDCFVAYLAGHNRPVHEVLFPNRLPLEPAKFLAADSCCPRPKPERCSRSCIAVS